MLAYVYAANARSVANVTIHGQVYCSVVTFSTSVDSGSLEYLSLTTMIISENCIPMAAASFFREDNTTAGIASEIDGAGVLLYYDVETLPNPDILTLPKICSSAQSLETSGVSKNKLAFFHMVN